MIPSNDWYGHKQALLDYCGVPRSRPVLALWSHGWAPDVDSVGDGHRRMTFAPYLVWNELHYRQSLAAGARNIRLAGAPFSYLVARDIDHLRATEGEGTLVFPAHSAGGRIDYEAQEFVRAVMSELPGPYTVSIFYQDLGTPVVGAYEAAGFRIVSFGSRHNPRFLTDLATEVATHAAVASNVVQTAVWYGALLGRRVRIVGKGAYPIGPHQDPEGARLRWPQLFDSSLGIDEIIALGEAELGFRHLMSPEELKSTLGLDSALKSATARAVRRAVEWRLRRSGEGDHS